MCRGTILSTNGPMAIIQSLVVEIEVPLFEVCTMSTQWLVPGLEVGQSRDIFLDQNLKYNRLSMS